MTTTTTTRAVVVTASGHVVELANGSIYQDGVWAGYARVRAGRIECEAQLGAADGSETEATYDALEAVL